MVRSGVIEVKLTPFLNSFELRLSRRRTRVMRAGRSDVRATTPIARKMTR